MIIKKNFKFIMIQKQIITHLSHYDLNNFLKMEKFNE